MKRIYGESWRSVVAKSAGIAVIYTAAFLVALIGTIAVVSLT